MNLVGCTSIYIFTVFRTVRGTIVFIVPTKVTLGGLLGRLRHCFVWCSCRAVRVKFVRMCVCLTRITIFQAGGQKAATILGFNNVASGSSGFVFPVRICESDSLDASSANFWFVGGSEVAPFGC